MISRLPSKLNIFIPLIISYFLLLGLMCNTANAQLVDALLGQKRTIVQVLLRPYRIMDYEKNRVVYNIEKGVHQTVVFENDTCKHFYWAVGQDYLVDFNTRLENSGYTKLSNGYVKDSLHLTIRPLNSGKATLFMARLSEKLMGHRDASGNRIREKKMYNFEAVPLLQQAILAQQKDTIAKKPKDPEHNWVGTRNGRISILGWD